MTQEATTSGTKDAVRGGSAIAVAIVAMNLTTYAFTILAAGLMGPRSYGAFAAIMNVLLVAGVLALALQATAARRIAREPGDAHEVEHAILLVGRRSAVVLALVFAALSPIVNIALRLHSLPAALLLAVAVAPATLMGAQAGVLQGERRWVPLALVYLSAGVPRLCLGVALLEWKPEEFTALVAVALGAFVPVLVAGVALREPRSARTADAVPGDDHSARALWWETVYNSQALLAFLVLSSIDIVLARNALGSHDSGLYASGLIMVKAVTFLPQFVVVLAFPSMGTDDARRKALLGSLVLVAVTGIVVTIGVRLLPGLALTFVGGSSYDGIRDRLWIFAVLGTVLSMLQLLVYSVLARQSRNSVILLWIALVPLIFLGLKSSSVLQLVTRVLAVDSALLALLLGLSLWKLRIDSRAAAGAQD
ncbi:MAG TPA: polysaccharide biosynthesis protein [Marmoricola sp.]|nr:polysaccharide biosynthesis protein [Marmoricola sp.]